MAQRLSRGGRRILLAICGLLTMAALAVAALLIVIERLPRVLPALVAHLAPGFELELGQARLRGLESLELGHVRLRERGSAAPLLAAKRIRARFTPWDLRHGRIEEVRLVAPVVSPPATTGRAASGGGGGEGWRIGRLVTHDGRFRISPSADHPGVTSRFAFDLRDLGLGADLSDRVHRIRLRDVRATFKGSPPVLVVDAVRARFTVGDLLERLTIDAVRLVRPAFSVPETLPALAGAGDQAPGTSPVPEWRIARLVVPRGHLRVPPSGDRPEVAVGFAFNLRDLGLGPLADRPHQLRLRDVRVGLGGGAPSLVVDSARATFALGELFDRHRLTELVVNQGTLVVDGRLRARLASGGSAAPGEGAGPLSLGVLDIRRLGIRLSELGHGIPDVTLSFRTTLRDVPLSATGLERASDPQRIELADASLYSPVDPFRRVVHVGDIFVDFTLAELLRQRIGAVTLVSPTIYLGEDLIWYMSTARGETPGGPAPSPWTIRQLRADLGRIVLTLNGSERLMLPISFHTQAHNVALGDLAALRLAAELTVPRQSYRFPGFDAELVDLEGDLHFDYPPGKARDNVVNVLKVSEVRWRDYRLGAGWLSVTFDGNGINGGLGAQAYEGYLNAGVSVPFAAGPPSSGWLSGTRLDLGRIAAVAGEGRLEMAGSASLKGTLVLRDGRIEAADGHLTLDQPGRLSFPDLDTLLERLPEEAPSWQRDLARIGVETLRDYPYTTGEGALVFADHRGQAHLSLDGERGARRFELHYYEDAPVVVRVARMAE